jgi:hypothetical protein
MSSLHYCAASTNSGFFLTCDDRHSTIGEAAACVSCAGGYIVAVEKGVMRALQREEEAEFQSIVHSSVKRRQLLAKCHPQEPASPVFRRYAAPPSQDADGLSTPPTGSDVFRRLTGVGGQP